MRVGYNYIYCALTLLFTIGSSNFTSAQTPMNGSLTGHVYSIINNLPGSGTNQYTNPTPTEFTQWETLVSALLNENYSSATSQANAIDYDLIEFTDGTETYYILQKQNAGSNFWGTYVFNPNSCRNIVLQAPHPKKDFNTGKQGIYVLQNTNARFYCLAGTHRCNHSSFSTCSGTTSSCDTVSNPFRISDVAHNDNCILQATTKAIRDFDNQTIFIQFHGFTKLSSDPYVIMSNGTQITPSPDYINQLKNELLVADNTLSFKVAHQDLTWTRLRGFTNVQGRLINNSVDICSTDASTTTGNFIHIEQEKTKLRDDSTKWDKMVLAINNTFSCFVSSTLEITQVIEFKIYPNPTKESTTITFTNSKRIAHQLTIFDASGRIVKTINNITSNQVVIEKDNLNSGLYFIQLQNDFQIGTTQKVVFE
jgi:hypothetical protein